MNPKTLQYIMGHSEIGVTLNTYTHLGYEDAEEEMQKIVDVASKKSTTHRKKCVCKSFEFTTEFTTNDGKNKLK